MLMSTVHTYFLNLTTQITWHKSGVEEKKNNIQCTFEGVKY